MSQNKKTLVIGASEDPGRYAYRAVLRLKQAGHTVIALGKHTGKIDDLSILTGTPQLNNIHTVTLYIRPGIQQTLYNYIIELKPDRIIFNPGTENPEFEKLAQSHGIETLEACTLVLLSIGSY
jgi:uncharacterized protein